MALLGLGKRASLLAATTRTWSGGQSVFTRHPPGAGSFRFDEVTVGLVLSEQPRHEARYGDGRPRLLPLWPGHGWIFPAGMDGWCAWAAPQDVVNLSLPAAVLAAAGGEPGRLPIFAGELDPLMAELIFHLHAAPAEAASLYRDSLASALAAHLVRGPRGALEPIAIDRRIRRAVDYIEAHLAEDVALAELAAAATLSPYHFARSFKAATGLPPHRFLVARRMERAKALLAAADATVAEVAWQVGYRDATRFATLFRRHVGITPGAFRATRRG